MRDKVQRAKQNPLELTNLLCKDFNVRQSDQDNWLTFDVIDNTETFTLEDLSDNYAIGGVDLSSTTDLTCATLLIYKNNLMFFFLFY